MIFLDPMIDIAFKRLFGDQTKKEILISFINAVLDLPEGEKVVDVVMCDPFNNPDVPWLKISIVDVRCVDQRGSQYIVELQVEKEDDYRERSQYYAAHALARQLKKGERYAALMPVIFIGIVDFTLIPGFNFFSKHQLLNTKTHEHSLKLMEFYYIELPKFTKTSEELETVMDKWIYLLKNASDFEQVPELFRKDIAFEEALDVLKRGHLTAKELALYDRAIEEERVKICIRHTQMNDEKERAKKLEHEALRRAASTLLKKFDVAQVAEMVELSVEEVQELKDKK